LLTRIFQLQKSKNLSDFHREALMPAHDQAQRRERITKENSPV
jgi:hypothetical protein